MCPYICSHPAKRHPAIGRLPAPNRLIGCLENSYLRGSAASTVRARRLRERCSRCVAMVAPVEVGEGGIELLFANDLLKPHETRDRKAVGEACLAALEAWAAGRSAQSLGR